MHPRSAVGVVMALALVAARQDSSRSPAPVAPLDSTSFDAALAAVRDLVDDQHYADAKEQLLALVSDHGDQPYVRSRRRDVAEELTRCALRLAVPRPDPQSLISGRIVERPKGRGGEIMVVYEPGRFADFQPFKPKSPIRIHPLLFTGIASLELSGDHLVGSDGSDHMPITIIAGADEDEAIRVTIGLRPKSLAAGETVPWYARTTIERLAGGGTRLLASTEESPIAGESFRLRVTVGEAHVVLLSDGEKLLEAKKTRGRYGRFGLTLPRELTRITLLGRAGSAWLDGVVDAALRDQERDFLARYDVDAELPAWLRGGGDATGELRLFDVGPDFAATPKQRMILEAVKRLRSSEKPEHAIDYVEQLAAGVLPVDVRDWEIARTLVQLGDETALRVQTDAMRNRDPTSLLPDLALARFFIAAARFEEAHALATQLLADHPAEPRAAALLAECQLYRGEPEAAAATLRTAHEANVESATLATLDAIVVQAQRGPLFTRRFETDTTHFHVASDIDAATGEAAAAVLEESYEVYSRFFGAPAGDAGRLPVYLFAGRAGYLDYSERIGSDFPHSTAGLYLRLVKQLLVWNAPDRNDFWHTLRHEACHQFLDRLDYRAPRWFEEGMAEYAAALTLRAESGVEASPLDRGLVRALLRAEATLPSLRAIVRTSPGEFYAGGRLSYSYATALVHFLLQGGEEVDAIRARLFQALHDHVPEREIVRAAFADVDLGELEDRFFAWLVQQR